MKTYIRKNWIKKIVNLKHDEVEPLTVAAKAHGYQNLHEAMRSLTLSLLATNPTSAIKLL